MLLIDKHNKVLTCFDALKNGENLHWFYLVDLLFVGCVCLVGYIWLPIRFDSGTPRTLFLCSFILHALLCVMHPNYFCGTS
jgi:hypothetical protein